MQARAIVRCDLPSLIAYPTSETVAVASMLPVGIGIALYLSHQRRPVVPTGPSWEPTYPHGCTVGRRPEWGATEGGAMAYRSPLSRRTVLKLMSAGGLALYLELNLSACADPVSSSAPHPSPTKAQLVGTSPIDRSLGDMAPVRFFGDESERPHKILW